MNRANISFRILFRTFTMSRRRRPVSATVESPGIQVSADTSPKIDLKLSVGSASETVTVTTEPPQLQTDSADVGTVFNERTISGLPIPNRNFASLQLLIPGAQAMGWTQNNAEDAQGSPTVNIQGHSSSLVLGICSTAPRTRTPFWGRSSSIRRWMPLERPKSWCKATTRSSGSRLPPW